MRAVLRNGTEVKIVFTHQHLTEPQLRLRKNGLFSVMKAVTTVSIIPWVVKGAHETLIQGYGPPLSSAESWCAEEDTFCKEVGRQLSLRRAVERLGREDAGRVLKAYFDRKKEGR